MAMMDNVYDAYTFDTDDRNTKLNISLELDRWNMTHDDDRTF